MASYITMQDIVSYYLTVGANGKSLHQADFDALLNALKAFESAGPDSNVSTLESVIQGHLNRSSEPLSADARRVLNEIFRSGGRTALVSARELLGYIAWAQTGIEHTQNPPDPWK